MDETTEDGITSLQRLFIILETIVDPLEGIGVWRLVDAKVAGCAHRFVLNRFIRYHYILVNLAALCFPHMVITYGWRPRIYIVFFLSFSINECYFVVKGAALVLPKNDSVHYRKSSTHGSKWF